MADQAPDRTEKIEVYGNVVVHSVQWKGATPVSTTDSYRFFCLPDTIDPRGPKGK